MPNRPGRKGYAHPRKPTAAAPGVLPDLPHSISAPKYGNFRLSSYVSLFRGRAYCRLIGGRSSSHCYCLDTSIIMTTNVAITFDIEFDINGAFLEPASRRPLGGSVQLFEKPVWSPPDSTKS